MKRKKSLIILLVLLLLVPTILLIFGGNNMRPQRALNDFSRLIEQGRVSELRLTIYFMSSSILATPFPLSLDDLINGRYEYKIFVDGSSLEEHVDLLNQISDVTLIRMNLGTRIDARIYYVFETEGNRRIFDFAMWATNDTVFINGVEVKANEIFHDIIMPFLPEDAAQELRELQEILRQG